MDYPQIAPRLRPSYSLVLSLVVGIAGWGHAASEHHGQVRFGELPVPGVVVRAAQGNQQLGTITDSHGAYSFAGLADGVWTIQVEMAGFGPIRRELTIAPGAAATVWELKMLAIDEMDAGIPPGLVAPSPAPLQPVNRPPALGSVPTVPAPASETIVSDSVTQRASQVLLINGSVSSGESPAFGNNRRKLPLLYTGDVNIAANNSAFDARSFSLTGQDTPKPHYSRTEASINLSGPVPTPFLSQHGPMFTLMYSRVQNRDVSLETARVPTPAERLGDFSQSANVLTDPATGSPFWNNVIPLNRITPQARSLLDLFPLPNFTGNAGYNYQIPLAGVTHRDNFQLQSNGLAAGNHLSASFSFQSSRADSPSLAGFIDSLNTSAVNGALNWSRPLVQHLTASASYTFNRTVIQTIPYFADRQNVSRDSGIGGNSQDDPRNWGPPNLNFSGGIAPLSDGQYAFDRTQSSAISHAITQSGKRYAWNFGVGFRRQQFNLLSQPDARGTFTFTGAASRIDFADFLLGIPSASSIAFGNPDKYLRQSGYDLFFMHDWRVKESVTLNLGVRWEYEAPITERYDRLVNLDIAPDFGAIAPTLASQPHGLVTDQVYPSSLVRPDKGSLQPRIGLAWRPRATSSLVIRGGYGIYRDIAAYRSIAEEMAQQSPLSRTLRVGNSPSAPLTLANGFVAPPLVVPNTFAVDPSFRLAFTQNWLLSIQRDLLAAFQVTATYVGIKGSHLPQRSLPNTFPSGASQLCPTCPAGYVYLTSDGKSNRHAGTIGIRRRQRNGFAADLQYTWSKAIDDAGLGGHHIAQDWLDRKAERALSNFDQRRQMTARMAYTTGMRAGIGALRDGFMGTLLREWTVMMEWNARGGLPLTPIIIAPVQRTGVTGSLRPDRTGMPLYTGASDVFLNPAAFALPPPGKWGNAGRNSITGPAQFSLDASIGHTFAIGEGISMDFRMDVTNILNHVTFQNWNTTVGSTQFGLPTGANSMRMFRPMLQVRF